MIKILPTASVKERALIKRADQFCRSIDRAFAAKNCPFSIEQASHIETFRLAADHLRWSYPAKISYMQIEPEHRLATMFSGPLYTDEANPWPHDKRGRPLEPICQIDLAVSSTLGDLHFGDGLLQLWMEDSIYGRLRLVPKHQVQLKSLTPVPFSAIQYVWPNPRGFRFFRESNDWSHGYVMTAVSTPVMTVPNTLVSVFDNIPIPPNAGMRLRQAFDAMERSLQNNEVVDQSPGEIGFFGNFSSIQYDEIDSPEVLIAMESGCMFMWGDCGNAQIFYAPNKSGNFDFSFEWSC